MNKNTAKAFRKDRRHLRVRKRVTGTPTRPRLSVYKSLKHIHAQIIDDLAGKTLAACSSVESEIGKQSKSATAAAVGAKIAERAKAAGVTAVVFDRGGSRYHGRLKALADSARKAGLSF